MPRLPRLHVPGGCYHVTLRGNHRETLFGSVSDRVKLNAIVADAIGRFDVRLHAYCWMTNHLHALVQVESQPLGGFIQSVATRFSRFRHKALDTTGHLFERRYGARLVAVDNYFLAVLRYIHLNPVQAGIASDPADYPWSSHRAYLGTQTIGWLTISLGLSLLGDDQQKARQIYAGFVGGEPAEGQPDIDAHGEDRRVLGDRDFLTRVRPPVVAAGGISRLDTLAKELCTERGIPLELLRSKASRHQLTPLRLELLDRSLSAGAASLAEVARYLGRDPSTLCKQWQKARVTVRKSPTNPMTGT